MYNYTVPFPFNAPYYFIFSNKCMFFKFFHLHYIKDNIDIKRFS